MSTPNDYDERWIEAINDVMSERESPARIVDIDEHLWNLFLGPLCDAIEDGLDNVSPVERIDRKLYSVHPSDVCDYPECDRLKRNKKDTRCEFHHLLRQRSLGKKVDEKRIEAAFNAD